VFRVETISVELISGSVFPAVSAFSNTLIGSHMIKEKARLGRKTSRALAINIQR
tara:strand:+ start:4531 stop:4692 length:162 start_codon:yes stop_codon:yes gene_type:complete